MTLSRAVVRKLSHIYYSISANLSDYSNFHKTFFYHPTSLQTFVHTKTITTVGLDICHLLAQRKENKNKNTIKSELCSLVNKFSTKTYTMSCKMNALQLCSLNVRGLKAFQKENSFSDGWEKKLTYLFLQETHCTTDQADQYRCFAFWFDKFSRWRVPPPK